MTDATVQSPAAAPIAKPAVKKAPIAKAAKAVKATNPIKAAQAPVVKAPAPKPAPKSVVKPAAKPAAKPVVAAKNKVPAKPAKAVAAPKPVKLKKPKMVRDSMTMPKAEYAVIDQLKQRAAQLDRSVKKTELLRAGIKALAAMSDASFIVALKAVPSLKTGRPSKS